MPIVDTVMNTIDILMANTQIVMLTVLTQMVLYSAVQLRGWWSKK